jgi:ribonuclease Z
MTTTLQTDRYTIIGRSLGGMYTGLYVPELDVLFDAGTALRRGAGAANLFLSHAHVDHVGALPALLGMRGLVGLPPPTIYAPAEVARGLPDALRGFSALHRWSLDCTVVGLEAGDEVQLRRDLWVRAFRTFHPVPSLGYLFFNRVAKLRPEFRDLPGAEIGRRRQAGHDLFDTIDHLELAYATDTLPEVLRHEPSLFKARVTILECTFLDERKAPDKARAGCHIHLDELLRYASEFQNEALVLMHFSQLYQPAEVHRILAERWPANSFHRVRPLAPIEGEWWD